MSKIADLSAGFHERDREHRSDLADATTLVAAREALQQIAGHPDAKYLQFEALVAAYAEVLGIARGFIAEHPGQGR